MGIITFILCPHSDDGEMGCGGTIAKRIEKEDEIHYIAFSVPEPTDQLLQEIPKATAMLGIPYDNVHINTFLWRNFPSQRQNILDLMIKLKNKYKPEVVYCPSSADTHQDHKVIHEEATRAYRGTTLLGYEIPRNAPKFAPTRWEVLEKRHVEKKLDALSVYRSQEERPHWRRFYWESTLKFRGQQIEAEWAEAFEVITEVPR